VRRLRCASCDAELIADVKDDEVSISYGGDEVTRGRGTIMAVRLRCPSCGAVLEFSYEELGLRGPYWL